MRTIRLSSKVLRERHALLLWLCSKADEMANRGEKFDKGETERNSRMPPCKCRRIFISDIDINIGRHRSNSKMGVCQDAEDASALRPISL